MGNSELCDVHSSWGRLLIFADLVWVLAAEQRVFGRTETASSSLKGKDVVATGRAVLLHLLLNVVLDVGLDLQVLQTLLLLVLLVQLYHFVEQVVVVVDQEFFRRVLAGQNMLLIDVNLTVVLTLNGTVLQVGLHGLEVVDVLDDSVLLHVVHKVDVALLEFVSDLRVVFNRLRGMLGRVGKLEELLLQNFVANALLLL